MPVIVAVNLPDRLVLFEDGRELPITQFYKSCPAHDIMGPLTAKGELRSCCRISDCYGAEVFVVEIPGADAALIVEMPALILFDSSQIN